MKILIVLSAFVFLSHFSIAQSDSTAWRYCEMIGNHKPFGMNKVTITLDFGEAFTWWVDPRVRDEQNGKVKTFNSMVDAMNIMAEDDWQFLQAYAVTNGSFAEHHWILRKRKDK
jgi:hypothetical protein